MPNLKDGWFADRAPGGGKVIYTTAGDSSTATPVGGLVGVGASGTPPTGFPVLPEPGTPIAPAGSSERASFFAAFRAAVGFDGSTWLTFTPAASTSTALSISAWLNFGVTSIAGFTPNPDVGIFTSFDNTNNQFGAGDDEGLRGTPPSAPYIAPSGSGNWSANADKVIAYPSDGTTNAGWVHLMWSFKDGQRAMIWVNDEEIFSLSSPPALGAMTLTNAAIGKPDLGKTTGIKCAMAEYWLVNEYVDWSVETNRYKFHAVDTGFGVGNAVYAPVDLGPTGARPGFGKPLAYQTGNSALFPTNRARGTTLTVVTTTSGLFDVDDPPG